MQAPWFRLYGPYVNNFDNATAILKQLGKKTAWTAFLVVCHFRFIYAHTRSTTFSSCKKKSTRKQTHAHTRAHTRNAPHNTHLDTF